MSSAFEITRRHMQAALQEGEAHRIPADVIARAFLDQVLDIYRAGRSFSDIASELSYLIENLDPEGDHTFMRP
jgi:hypothetical protein